MTQEDLNEVMGKSLANHQLRALAEDGGNLASALALIDRLESELLDARAEAEARNTPVCTGKTRESEGD